MTETTAFLREGYKMKPNVILINIDDMGYADTSCYGSKINYTPNIDKLAQEGMKLTDFYAAAPLCTPSRAGLLTGCYPKRLDFNSFKVFDRDTKEEMRDFAVLMPGQPEGLAQGEKTLGTLFKEAGYATEIIGKWHLGDQPQHLPLNYGFDKYYGIPYSNDMGISIDKREILTRTICPLPLIRDNEVIEEQPDCEALAERMTCEAIDFIKENKENPFFLYFAHYYVHNPLHVAKPFMKKSTNGLLGGAMASVDWTVGMIEYQLKKLGISNNTIIIFTSDNGGPPKSSNFPLRGGKGSTWEGGERVNCIIKWPEVIKKGRVSSEIVSMIDFYPTFADILGIDINDGIIRDGVSVYNVLSDENQKSKRETFFYYSWNNLDAVRKGDFKLHLATKQLYNLREDVSESENIYDETAPIVKELAELAQLCRADMGDELTGIKGKNCREKSYVKDFKTLTTYDPNHPYIVAEYD